MGIELRETRPVPARPGRRQMTIIAIILMTLMIDGVDLQFLSIVSPLVIKQWNIDTASVGIALSAALAGMALGSGAGGRLGDGIGRKPALLASLALFGVATGLSALVSNVPELACLRLASGIGFGAATPNALALGTEWLPPRRGANVAALMSIGTPLGSVLASVLVAAMLPLLGWRGCFAAFGVLTLLVGMVALAGLPESARFLVRRGRPDRAEKLANAVLGANGFSLMAVADIDPTPSRGGLGGPAMRRFNIAVGICFGTASFVTYGLANWLPMILTGLGFSFTEASSGLLVYMTLALFGALASGRLVTQFGSRRLTLAALALALLASGLFVAITLTQAAVLPRSFRPGLYALVAGFGIAQGLVTGSLYALVALRYPVEIRATGIGVALTIAKLGGVAAILSSGALLAHADHPAAALFSVIMVVLGGLGAGILLIDRHLPAAQTTLATEYLP